MAEITFEKFSSKCKQEFVDLNLAWLKDSFAVEPHDVAVLEDCEVCGDDEFTENCSVLRYFSLGKHFGAWWPNSPRKTRRGGNLLFFLALKLNPNSKGGCYSGSDGWKHWRGRL